MESMHEPGLHDPFPDQLNAARFMAERDAARQELERMRPAAEWVEAKGGIDAIRRRLKESIPLEVVTAKTARQQRHIEDIQGKLAERNERIAELEHNLSKSVSDQLKADAALYDLRRKARDVCEAHGIDPCDDPLRAIDEALDRRLMPEGMEWPRYDTGEPLRIGDAVTQPLGSLTVMSVEFTGRGGCELKDAPDGDWSTSRHLSAGNVVYRAAPKVLDADGAEIRVGDTVYLLPGDWCDRFPCFGYHGGEELEVFSLSADHVGGVVGCRDTGRLRATCYPQPSQLTHRAPVLAADGRPLREGETVWDKDGAEFVVDGFDENGVFGKWRTDDGWIWAHPCGQLFTHERPDSLDRLADDIGAMVEAWRSNRDLFDAQEAAAGCVGENTMGAALDSLVRRAKKLAGVGECLGE